MKCKVKAFSTPLPALWLTRLTLSSEAPQEPCAPRAAFLCTGKEAQLPFPRTIRVSAGKQRPSTASLVLHPLPFIQWHTFNHLPPKAKKIVTFSLQMVGASGHSSQVTELHLMLQGCSSCPPLPLQPQQKPLANALSANLPFSIRVKLQVIQLPDEACLLHQAIQT